jgi:hypothetical protein
MSACHLWTDTKSHPRGKSGRGVISMMSEKIFIDTNILVYALDMADGKKQKRARQLLQSNHSGSRIKNPFLKGD